MNNSPAMSYGPRPIPVVAQSASRTAATLAWAALVIGLGLSPLGDFLSVYAAKGAATQGADARVSLLLRGMMIAGLMAALLSGCRVSLAGLRRTILFAFVLCATLGSFVLGALTGHELLEQMVFALKVFTFFVYPAAMLMLSDRRLAQIESVVFVSLLVYGLSIVIGASLSIDMFRSYQADTQIRSGYKGIIYAQNEAAALVVAAIGFGYLHALLRGWTWRSVALVACMLVAAALTGTKGAMLGALGVTCAYLYARHNALKASGYAGIALLVLGGAAAGAYLFIPKVTAAVDLSLRYFEYRGGRIGNDKVLTLLLSGRNLKFANVWADLQQNHYIALLTGGHPVVRYMVEIDVPDLILAFGFPIFVMYFASLTRVFVRGGQHRNANRFGRLFFFVLIAMASSAGHVLGSAVVSPYLALIAVMIRRARRPVRDAASHSPSI
ncbi:O-antigen ligase family protein [Burkholderia stagnalis]|uniref:O-antigen ligase family protein n=1 Tax=Burkholderia stagnalis TaxID=1503054 RepID=UPI000B13B3FD|nr:O-antigen ligase family protein [Burkholderia stagnalis]